MSADKHLADIFQADRTLRDAEQLLLEADEGELSKVLSAAVADAKSVDDEAEKTMRLQRLSDLCAQVPGPEMTDALIAILNEELPTVRVSAADALVDVAFERYAEVARGVERALDSGEEGMAMGELPWVLTEVADPSAIALITRFLKLQDSSIVASAVEALATLGDPAAVEALTPLVDDERVVELDEYEGEVSATLGELVGEAIELIEQGPARGEPN